MMFAIFYILATKIMTTMSLPAAIMRRIFACLDPKGLAKMAQVSTVWKTLVYRQSVWRQMYWVQKYYGYGSLFLRCVPYNAKHIGEQSQLCFHGWMVTHAINNCPNSIPKNIMYSYDSNNFVSQLKSYWISIGRPCVFCTHHKWSDMILCREYLSTLSHNDLEYFYFSVVDRSCHTTSTYDQFLLYEISISCPVYTAPALECPTMHNTKRSIVSEQNARAISEIHNRHAIVKNGIIKLRNSLSHSEKRIKYLGQRLFEANDELVDKSGDKCWDAATFHSGSPTAASLTESVEIVQTMGLAPTEVKNVLVFENGLEPKKPA